MSKKISGQKFIYECIDCGKQYFTNEIIYLCSDCSKENTENKPPKGVLKLIYNYSQISKKKDCYNNLKKNHETLRIAPSRNNPKTNPSKNP